MEPISNDSGVHERGSLVAVQNMDAPLKRILRDGLLQINARSPF
ncbi:hypothetical protein [Pseudogracilibacillus sp. SO30301A]